MALRVAIKTAERFSPNKTSVTQISLNFACMSFPLSIMSHFSRSRRKSYSSRSKIFSKKCSDLAKIYVNWTSKTQFRKEIRKEITVQTSPPAVLCLARSKPKLYMPQKTTSCNRQLLPRHRNLTRSPQQICRYLWS